LAASSDSSARHQEAREILNALNQQAQEAAELAEAARHQPAHPFNHPYRRFREKLTDFEGLASLLQQRVSEARDSWSRRDDALVRWGELREQFERLDLLMLGLFARTTIQFVESLAEADELPMGSAEGLGYDLVALRTNLARLQSPDLAGRADPALAASLAKAESSLQQIIARVPPMLDFGKDQRTARPARIRRMLGGPRPH
jgi:hypothetical protein